MKRKFLIKTITFDQWAESGGTAGIFDVLRRQGRLKIVSEIPKLPKNKSECKK